MTNNNNNNYKRNAVDQPSEEFLREVRRIRAQQAIERERARKELQQQQQQQQAEENEQDDGDDEVVVVDIRRGGMWRPQENLQRYLRANMVPYNTDEVEKEAEK